MKKIAKTLEKDGFFQLFLKKEGVFCKVFMFYRIILSFRREISKNRQQAIPVADSISLIQVLAD